MDIQEYIKSKLVPRLTDNEFCDFKIHYFLKLCKMYDDDGYLLRGSKAFVKWYEHEWDINNRKIRAALNEMTCMTFENYETFHDLCFQNVYPNDIIFRTAKAEREHKQYMKELKEKSGVAISH